MKIEDSGHAPPKGAFITGTDTGVGKTVVTACLLSILQNHGLNTGIMKPIETGVDRECSSAANSDALFLMEVGRSGDRLEEVSPIRLKPAASPYQASQIEGDPIDPGLLARNFRILAERHDRMLVEGIGGILAPICRGYSVIDLVRDLDLPLIVVSRITLGTLNHTLLTLRAAQEKGINVLGVIFNQIETREINEIEKEQAALLQDLTEVPVLGLCPFIDPMEVASFNPERAAEIEKAIDCSGLIALPRS